MALRASALVQDTDRSGENNTLLKCYVRVVVFGSDIGDLSYPEQTIVIDEVRPALLNYDGDITAGVEAWLEEHEVPYTTIVDTIRIL